MKKNALKIVIEPSSNWKFLNIKELSCFFDLFFILTFREVKLRYRQTMIGVVWVVLQPLITAAVFSLILGNVIKLPCEKVPYIIFVFSGLLPWIFFSQAIQRAGMSLVGESRIITKVYFPRIILPAAGISSMLIDFLVILIVMVALLLIYAVPITISFFSLPFFLIIVYVLSLGIGSFFAALNVYYRDFVYALSFLIQIWMYVSPVMYSKNMIVEKWQFIYSLNPLVGIIDGFRWAILGTTSFPFFSVSVAIFESFVIAFLGISIFKKIEKYFADVI